MNDFTVSISAFFVLASSASSIIHTPAFCIAASLVPSSLMSSVNHSPPRILSAADLPRSCGPSSNRTYFAITAGLVDAGDGRDHPTQPDQGGVVRGLRRTEIGNQPAVEPG